MACSVTQLPINASASDAITGHKLQGLTKENVIVCSWNSSTNWIYIVLSRVRTLAGLYLYLFRRLLKLNDIKPPSRDYMAFLDRMKDLSKVMIWAGRGGDEVFVKKIYQWCVASVCCFYIINYNLALSAGVDAACCPLECNP